MFRKTKKESKEHNISKKYVDKVYQASCKNICQPKSFNINFPDKSETNSPQHQLRGKINIQGVEAATIFKEIQ